MTQMDNRYLLSLFIVYHFCVFHIQTLFFFFQINVIFFFCTFFFLGSCVSFLFKRIKIEKRVIWFLGFEFEINGRVVDAR